jgi:transcriptional regulator with XRE-family HTH domain
VNFAYEPPFGAEAARLAAGVGRIIREEREARGWSKAELKRRSGLATYGYEKGTTRPGWGSLCRLAEAFHLTDRRAAQALAVRLAEAAGPSLAGPPDLPTGLGREFVVRVVGNTLRRLGLDPEDDAVRHVVMEELRRLSGDPEMLRGVAPTPGGPIRAEATLAIEAQEVRQ